MSRIWFIVPVNEVFAMENGCVAGLGAFTEAYPFEVCHMSYVMTFDPHMYFMKLELPIYKIILSAEGSKRAIISPYTNPNRCHAVSCKWSDPKSDNHLFVLIVFPGFGLVTNDPAGGTAFDKTGCLQ